MTMKKNLISVSYYNYDNKELVMNSMVMIIMMTILIMN